MTVDDFDFDKYRALWSEAMKAKQEMELRDKYAPVQSPSPSPKVDPPVKKKHLKLKKRMAERAGIRRAVSSLRLHIHPGIIRYGQQSSQWDRVYAGGAGHQFGGQAIGIQQSLPLGVGVPSQDVSNVGMALSPGAARNWGAIR